MKTRRAAILQKPSTSKKETNNNKNILENATNTWKKQRRNAKDISHLCKKKTKKTMHICQKFVKTIKKSKTHINKKHCKVQNTYENSFKQIAKPTTKKKETS